MEQTTIIIPTRNEENAIVEVVSQLTHLSEPAYRIIVIDKSDNLNTLKNAILAGAGVLEQKSCGKGNAIKEAIAYANEGIIIFFDGDNSYPANRAVEFEQAILEGNDIVYGVRNIDLSNTPLLNCIGNYVFSFIASTIWGKTTDLLTGMIAIRRKTFLSLDIQATGFELETELFIKACKHKLKIKEIPILYVRRTGDKKLNPWKDGKRILDTMVRELLRR